MGNLGRAAVWRARCGGSFPGQPVAGSILRTAGTRKSDGAESDAVGVSPTDSGGRISGPEKISVTLCDFWRRSVGDAKPASVVRTAWGRKTTPRKYVWH